MLITKDNGALLGFYASKAAANTFLCLQAKWTRSIKLVMFHFSWKVEFFSCFCLSKCAAKWVTSCCCEATICRPHRAFQRAGSHSTLLKNHDISFYIFNFNISVGDASVLRGVDRGVLPHRAAAWVGWDTLEDNVFRHIGFQRRWPWKMSRMRGAASKSQSSFLGIIFWNRSLLLVKNK